MSSKWYKCIILRFDALKTQIQSKKRVFCPLLYLYIKHPPRNHCEMGVLYKYEKPNSRYKGTAFCAYMQIYCKKKAPTAQSLRDGSVTI